MRRNSRYILYLIIGVAIYYAMEGDKRPENLEGIREIAPFAILIIFLLLMVVRSIRKSRE